MNALTQRYAKRSNTRLFSSKGDRHETHLPTLGSPPQADPRVSRAHEDRRRTQGSARAARQGPRPALGLTLRRLAIGASRQHRLRGAAAFADLFRNGRRIDAEHLQLLALPAAGPAGRVGYVIGKKQLGRAVDRNRLKRMLREVIRQRRPGIAAYDVVLRLRRGCAASELRNLAAEAAALLDVLEAGA